MKRALVLLVACQHAGPARTLAVAPVVSLPQVAATQLVELGDAVYVFSPGTITIARGGSVVASVPATHDGHDLFAAGQPWNATTIPALDGEGRWVVANSADGAIWRVTASGELESIGSQLGVAGEHVRAIHGAGSTFAIAFDGGVAVSTDGVHLARYPATGRIAVARNRLAIASDTAVDVWDLAHGTRASFPIAHATAQFVDAEHDASRLAIATGRALWLEQAGALHRVAVPGELELVVSGRRLWVRAHGTLYVLDGDALVRTDVPVVTGAVFGSRDGDLWVAGAGLQRYSPERGASDRGWQAQVAPVFQRVCSHCHLPGGDADVDLSTAAAWNAERAEIVRRVLVTRTMPPAGIELGDADRKTLASWLGEKP